VQVRSAPAHEVRAAQAALRLVLFVPEVPTAALGLRELALLVPSLPDVERQLGLASAAADPDARRVHLYAAQDALLHAHSVLPLATVPLGLRVVPALHGASMDALGRPRLDDAWLEP
jgi:MarR-like DNA-binding transcriptional regulator SgrR of sgrS sRNA